MQKFQEIIMLREMTGAGVILKAVAVAAWLIVSLMLWGTLAATVYLGSAMAEPPPPEADFTILYVSTAIVGLVFCAWIMGTWVAFRKMEAGAVLIGLASLFALPIVALIFA
ncbi:hypothetical protein [Sphingosinicella humi]|uniref:Uncharacterized protein n=1 Tax=Allosphingosinicella humi TaxID=2068657 RepID=A0A2U2J003_9SPHN|nr:hypothetical protein [Sphingosinicella humi]PWG01665.1 hypothetical protein DF286_01340 [Sphingosinicella humi]